MSTIKPPLRLRRSEKAIVKMAQMEAVIRDSQVCRLALADTPYPYIVPLCFGYDRQTLYFHSAHQGRKIDLISKNPKAGFEIEVDCKTIPADKPCAWGMNYRSIIGGGDIRFMEALAEKRLALDIIMNHYSGRRFAYEAKVLEKTLVFCLDVRFMTGKQSG